jgi:hypothetical protein
MNEQRDEVRVERVSTRGVSRALPIATFLVGIFIGAAFVKPWEMIFPPATTSIVLTPTRTAEANIAATPTPAPTPSGPAECAFAGGWRVFALGQRDRFGGDGSTVGGDATASPNGFSDIRNPLRRWLEIAPLADVSGPDDDRIPFVTIVSVQTSGIGYCPPPGGIDGPPAGSRLQAWALDNDGSATSLQMEPITLDASSVIHLEVEVFIAADEDATGGGRWAPGRYVFAVASPDGGYGRWFGVEIRTPPGL